MYSEYSPCRSLSSYVDKYWEFKGTPGIGIHINILPDGCTDFIFTLGEVANAVDNRLIMQPYRSYFVGPMNKYSELITHTETVHMLGIRFLPGGIFRFMQLPLHELVNQRINTNEINSIFNTTFTERLCNQTNLKARIRLIEQLLLQNLGRQDLSDPKINFAIHQINLNQGRLPIRLLMEEICLCQRHFERKFKLFTGFTPKAYSRIMKFKNATELLQRANTDTLLSIAVDCGYYDAAHLANEIKTLSGKSASSFLSPQLQENVTLTYI